MKKLVFSVALLALFTSQAVSDSAEKEQSEFFFARLKFNMDLRWVFGVNDMGQVPWEHDYPFSEDLFLTMVKEVTGIHTTPESYEIVELSDDDVFKYPFLYVSEPGFMDLTNREARNMGQYLKRGGFMMFDDFRGRDLDVLRQQLKRVFPDKEMVRLDASHPVFHSFYEINSVVMDPPYRRPDAGIPEFWGMSDDNGRLMLVANQNNDFGEFWEWVDRGEMPFTPAAQSVRFGVNYLVYAMTH
jgi:hypothetical protein